MTTVVTDRAPSALPPGADGAPAGRRSQDLFGRASSRLRRAVPFDSAGWFAVDPATILPVSPALIENTEVGHCESYWDREGRVEDVLLFRDLARAPVPAGTLRSATAGSPARSTRYREYMAPQGYADELRVALRLGGITWGVAVLLRANGRAPFSARDVARVQALGPVLATEISGFATVAPATAGSDLEGGSGSAIFIAAGTPVLIDEQAQRWFVELAGRDWRTSRWLTTMISALMARAAAVADGRDRGPATVRLRSSTGRWLSVQASCLHGPGGRADTAAIVVEPALPTRVAPIVAEAYGLTPREQQVARGVARGLSNADIASSLHLSAHTVRDHLKATFVKVAVTSRGELVARLFADPVRSAAATDDVFHTEW